MLRKYSLPLLTIFCSPTGDPDAVGIVGWYDQQKKDYLSVRMTDKALALPKSKCITYCLLILSLGKFSNLSRWVNFSIRKCKTPKEHNQHFESIPLVQGRINPDSTAPKGCSPVCPSNSPVIMIPPSSWATSFLQHFILNSVGKLI